MSEGAARLSQNPRPITTAKVPIFSQAWAGERQITPDQSLAFIGGVSAPGTKLSTGFRGRADLATFRAEELGDRLAEDHHRAFPNRVGKLQ